MDVRPESRGEFLMLLDHPEEVVPLLPDSEVCLTVRAAGMAEGAWLLEMANSEQHQACFDLDCWDSEEFLPQRAEEWVDSLVEAGRETLARAVDRVDLEVWILTLRSLTGVTVLSKEEEPPDGAVTIDGVVHWLPSDPTASSRVTEIAHAMYENAPSHYWRVVYGLLFESPSECAEYALRWRAGRLADMGFPERAQAMRAYRPLDPDRTPTWEEPGRGSALVRAGRSPEKLEGTLVAAALARLPAQRASDILSYILSVANALAVADHLKLSDTQSIPRALEKAVRGIDSGLREVAKRRGVSLERALDSTKPMDLFRVGATLDPSLRHR